MTRWNGNTVAPTLSGLTPGLVGTVAGDIVFAYVGGRRTTYGVPD